MFHLAAPYPALQTTTVLPNPLFDDSEAGTSSVSIQHAIDGTRRSYVKTSTSRALQWEFRVTRYKGLELREFLLSYSASTIKVTDHNNRVWIGKFTGTPFQFEGSNRAGMSCQAPYNIGEQQHITLTFEGVEQ